MRLYFTVVFLLLFSNSSFCQAISESCSKKSNSVKRVRSATLSLQEIQETEKYDVTFCKLDLEASNTNTQLAGLVEMHIIAKENLDTVVYELFSSFQINRILLNGDSVVFIRKNAAIYLPVKALKGDKIIIQTAYAGKAPDQATNPFGGAGYSTKTVSGYNKRISWTLSDPFSAYEWWPCKQSLTDKVDSVDISITVPDSCLAGSNGVLEKVTILPGGKKRFDWKHRYPIDYYLISFSVGDYLDYSFYAHPENTADSILIQNYIYNDSTLLKNSKAILNNTASYLNYFSQIFTLYPFHKEKYGHCLAPIGGGMEHQTMTTLGMVNDQLIAHELAHQWWGNHVTYSSWKDVWLSEGFATYSEYLMLEKLNPGTEVQKLKGFQNNTLLQKDGSVCVKDTLNASSIFSRRFTYDKGAAIIHILRYIINNDSLFFGGLKAYQTKFSHSTASVLEFKQVMEAVAKVDLTDFFNQWFYGEGYPTYSAKLIDDNQGKRLFISHRGSSSKTTLFTNPIDISFTRKNNLSDTTIRFDINSNREVFDFSDALQLSATKTIDPKSYILRKTETFTSVVENQIDAPAIYPNPTHDYLCVDMEKPGVYFIQIYDMSGKLVLERTAGQNIKINVTMLAKGLYSMLVKSDNTAYSYKIMHE